MIKSAMFRVTNKNEGKLLAALNVVGDSIKCLDGITLHNMLGVGCLFRDESFSLVPCDLNCNATSYFRRYYFFENL